MSSKNKKEILNLSKFIILQINQEINCYNNIFISQHEYVNIIHLIIIMSLKFNKYLTFEYLIKAFSFTMKSNMKNCCIVFQVFYHIVLYIM